MNSFKDQGLGSLLDELNDEGIFQNNEAKIVVKPSIIEKPKVVIVLPEESPVEQVEIEDLKPVRDSLLAELSALSAKAEELTEADIVETRDLTIEEVVRDSFNKLYVAIGRLSDKVDRLAGVTNYPQIQENSSVTPQAFSGNPQGRSPAELIGTQIYRGKDAWKNVVTLGKDTAPQNAAMSADAAFAALEYLEPSQPVQPLDYGMNQSRRGPPPIPAAALRNAGARPAASVNAMDAAFDFLSDL